MKRKFLMPNLLKFKHKKLRANAARRPLRIGAPTPDYGELAEPSMKLSHALFIVLLLHVVAVAGIIAFNAIKTRQTSLLLSPTATTIGVAQANTKPQPLPAAQKTKPQAKVSDSGKTYVVAKGDNPVTIAKKFKVSYDDLVTLNHIDDSRKLKIGQRLLIPEKPKASKKSE